MKLLLIATGLFLLSLPATAGYSEMEVLRDVICTYETRGERFPERAIGAGGELGRCQIQPTTARIVGYRDSLWLLLTDRRTNDGVSLDVLNFCKRWLRTTDAQRLAYCYNAGPRAEYGAITSARFYAKQIAINYARATMPTTKLRLARR